MNNRLPDRPPGHAPYLMIEILRHYMGDRGDTSQQAEDLARTLDGEAFVRWCSEGIDLFAIGSPGPTLNEARRAADSVLLRLAAERERCVIAKIAKRVASTPRTVRERLGVLGLHPFIPLRGVSSGALHRRPSAREALRLINGG